MELIPQPEGYPPIIDLQNGYTAVYRRDSHTGRYLVFCREKHWYAFAASTLEEAVEGLRRKCDGC